DARIIDVSQTIREIRMIKSPYEVELIREAGRLNDSMFGQAREILKEGMTEVELSGSLEAFLRERGHLGLCRARGFNQEVFYGHIMSGPNLAVPSCSLGPTGGPGLNASVPQGAGLRVIKRNEPIQIDYLCVLNGYMVDQGRVFSLGEPPAKFRRLHSVALAIQEALVRAGVPGTPAEQLYETAVRMAQDAGVSTGFMGYPQSVPFVGHGVGLEVDELPLLGKKSPHVLQEGMIIAMEPKFIVPREGLAGIENTFVVTEKGLEKLTLFDDSMQVIGSN
ncbi:MAG: aminopeptidase P family protein, partial [Deltaproteobacteria bacterium]|nr:aminopeptidase P family protein [Deltaproteobacteria bacterium]